MKLCIFSCIMGRKKWIYIIDHATLTFFFCCLLSVRGFDCPKDGLHLGGGPKPAKFVDGKNSGNFSMKTNCESVFKNKWPPTPTNKSLILGFLMTMGGFLYQERLGLKIPGMISLAVEEINSKYLLPDNYTLQIIVSVNFN